MLSKPAEEPMQIRLPSILLSSLLFTSLYGDDVHISPRFQTVYILEMANSFDQHLASRLTASRVLWVVLDPKSADAVLTDSLDDTFMSWMQRTYAPGSAPAAAPSETDAAASTLLRRTSSRGTVFLVDPRRRLVLWSAYEMPKDSSSAEADKTAARLTNELKLAFGKK
jgi:hypothetical protein